MTKLCLQILKRDIDIPQIMEGDLKMLCYPPCLLITTSDFTSLPKITVKGLDRECGFNLRISSKCQLDSIP